MTVERAPHLPWRATILFCGSVAAATGGMAIGEPRAAGLLLLLGAATFLLLVSVDRPSSNWAVVAGVLLGVVVLLSPRAVVLALLLFLALADRRYPPRARAHLAASAILGFGSVLFAGFLQSPSRFEAVRKVLLAPSLIGPSAGIVFAAALLTAALAQGRRTSPPVPETIGTP